MSEDSQYFYTVTSFFLMDGKLQVNHLDKVFPSFEDAIHMVKNYVNMHSKVVFDFKDAALDRWGEWDETYEGELWTIKRHSVELLEFYKQFVALQEENKRLKADLFDPTRRLRGGD
jgi:ribosomal protein S17E